MKYFYTLIFIFFSFKSEASIEKECFLLQIPDQAKIEMCAFKSNNLKQTPQFYLEFPNNEVIAVSEKKSTEKKMCTIDYTLISLFDKKLNFKKLLWDGEKYKKDILQKTITSTHIHVDPARLSTDKLAHCLNFFKILSISRIGTNAGSIKHKMLDSENFLVLLKNSNTAYIFDRTLSKILWAFNFLDIKKSYSDVALNSYGRFIVRYIAPVTMTQKALVCLEEWDIISNAKINSRCQDEISPFKKKMIKVRDSLYLISNDSEDSFLVEKLEGVNVVNTFKIKSNGYRLNQLHFVSRLVD